MQSPSMVSRVPSLDGIRAVSVLLVVISHCGFGHIIPGGLGVSAFFFLSGYLITSLLLIELHQSKHVNWRHFFIRRFYRLFPPLIITLILAYTLCYLDLIGGNITLSGFLYRVFYLANYAQLIPLGGDIPNGLIILWSLAVEEHFYLLFPFIFSFFFIGRSRFTTLFVLVTMCIGFLAWRILAVGLLGIESRWVYHASDARMDSILIGCILAVCINPFYVSNYEKINKRKRLWLILFFLGLGVLLFSLLYRDDFFRDTFRYTLQGIALVPIFITCVFINQHTLTFWLENKALKKIGVYSYTIYLCHLVFYDLIKRALGVEDGILMFAMVAVTSVTFAALVDVFVDRHLRRYRRRLH
jgi:peptidoglycan/LPS O-acetylase OafA/YrhL